MSEMNLFEKPINFSDNLNNFKPTSFYRGHVVVVDDVSGEVVLEKDNLVVLRGRTFALEKMFNKENEIEGYNKAGLASKRICLWKAGCGGCVTGQHFNVLPVNPDCTSLDGEIPFIAVKSGTPRPEGYYGEVSRDGYDYYFAKTFEDMTWHTGTNENGHMDEVALKITLKITDSDFKTSMGYDENGNVTFSRDTFINEIALCIANPVKTDTIDRMDHIELATRLNFESEPYFSNLKSATIYYYIYA